MPHGAIAAGHPKTAEAGLEMFRLGGNVFDAVVAAVMASFVVEPTLTSPAGGGFLLAHTQNDENILFDFFTQTPRQKRDLASVDFRPVEVNFGSVTQEFHIGLGSIAVPGAIGGLFQVHQRLGKLPMNVVMEPAIHYGRSGVEVTAFQEYCFQLLTPILTANPSTRQIFTKDGALLTAGMILKIPDLANTLEYLAQAGAREFYQGDIGRQLVQNCQEQGGYLTQADLDQYQVIERQPLITQYRGNTMLTNPPPSSGGALIAFALGLLESLDLAKIPFGSVEHVRSLAKVMQISNLARKDGYDDRLYQPDVAARFLDAAHLEPYVRSLNTLNKWGSTTHVSAIDSEGNAASVTTTNGEGSSYIIPGTGVMTNNMLGEADLHPNGFHQWQEDVRISSMMAPTIILRDRQPEVVLGSGGSNRIRTAILQVVSNLIDFGMTVEDAVNSSRIHWEAGMFNIEPGLGNPASDRMTFPFDEQVELWAQQNMFFGGVHAVTRSAAGELDGAGDRRRGGVFGMI
ncbi:MAG: gamma-glutamyltransferase [Drouetiella hepatica Uher 2000/2452]|jgi:gamma-glutamyltranspeptidase/glutathione hydrolase|uniref:Glutathione hydrolase proenzyme n=1 Tax=Drouetiella hepatica Uher 2000/2452 TaxID=904376 RepID=A0A951QFM8_9CYAN|nr:gamma-glutamyltransferase [Drouetiella hepatica Uher 2000/2452]